MEPDQVRPDPEQSNVLRALRANQSISMQFQLECHKLEESDKSRGRQGRQRRRGTMASEGKGPQTNQTDRMVAIKHTMHAV